MAIYLNNFNSIITNGQANRLLKVLNNKKLNGEFSSLAAFRDRVNGLMEDLFSSKLEPLLKLYLALVGRKIDTETYNFMLEKIQDDLEIAFQEAIKIDEVQRSHEAIVSYQLKNIRHALADLQAKVSTHELIVTSKYGFGTSIYSDFSGATSPRLQRDTETSRLFIDPRTLNFIESNYDAAVDEIGKSLVLPVKDEEYVDITSARLIFDDVAINSGKEDVTPENNKISNIIDNKKGTYFSKFYLFPTSANGTETAPNILRTKIELDLGGATSVNFIEIEPYLLKEIKLESIGYFTSDNVFEEIDIEDRAIQNHRTKIFFKKIGASKIILVFSNENYLMKTNSVYKNKEVSLSSDIISPVLSDMLNITDEKEIENFTGKVFQIGFDNIKAGYASYENKGIFISQPKKLKNNTVKIAGLVADELRPTKLVTNDIEYISDTYPDNDNNSFMGSIEYWIIKKSYDENGIKISTDMIPILPINVERQSHERLILTHKYSSASPINDSGKLIFYTNVSEGNIKVYRNGDTLLSQVAEGSDQDGWYIETNLTNNTPNSGQRMQTGIHLTKPRAGDIYTVSYNPLTSNIRNLDTNYNGDTTHKKVVDLTVNGTALSFLDQVVLFSEYKGPTKIESSDVSLMIILRRNTADLNSTPILEKYLLALGLNDPSVLEE